MRTLHITNGDCAAEIMRRFLDDPVVITADVLHEGPAPNVDGDAWYNVRAGDDIAIRRALAESDSVIASASQYDEVILWFEHDLFDQLLLIRTLDLLSRAQGKTTISLICIDRFPGVDRFVGLGQLTADQLATLPDTRRPVTGEHFALATRAWDAFRSPDPTSLDRVRRDLTRNGKVLPFLGPALTRFFEEYPSATHGLSRTAEAILRALEPDPLNGHDLFVATQSREEAPFIGDWGFFDIVHDLARGRVPLISIAPFDRAVDLRRHTIAMTDRGRDVIDGRADAIALNGIDLWRGGVHLSGFDTSPWRWDGRRQTLVS